MKTRGESRIKLLEKLDQISNQKKAFIGQILDGGRLPTIGEMARIEGFDCRYEECAGVLRRLDAGFKKP